VTNQVPNPGKSNPSLWLEILRNGQLAFKLMQDPRVATATKILIPVIVAAYVLSPIDLVPDFIPVLGQLDDLAIIALAVKLFISLAPPAVVAEYRAGQNGAPGSTGAPGTPAGETVDATYRVVK
jgi:uncharacterized membrane protein YkvA (DUF1232 family)